MYLRAVGVAVLIPSRNWKLHVDWNESVAVKFDLQSQAPRYV